MAKTTDIPIVNIEIYRLDIYKYHLKKGNKILHTGITNDLQRHEYEHQQNYGNEVHN